MNKEQYKTTKAFAGYDHLEDFAHPYWFITSFSSVAKGGANRDYLHRGVYKGLEVFECKDITEIVRYTVRICPSFSSASDPSG